MKTPLQHNVQEEDERIIFIHIPKAAGTSARAFFSQAYGKNQVGWLHNSFNASQLHASAASTISQFRVIGGHFPYSSTVELPWRKTYIAVIREPISRAISLYRYIQRTETHPLHSKASSMSMLQMLESVPQFRVQVSNLQANWLSSAQDARGGTGTCESALENIQHNRFFVSTVSGVSSLFELIKRAFTLPSGLAYGKQNLSPTRIDRDSLNEEKNLIDFLINLNQEDSRLFNHIEGRPMELIATTRRHF